MITNICFHGIGTPTHEREPGESRYWVSNDTFLRILDEVHRHPDVRLSFDDGNNTDAALALPALRARGLRATFFALAGRLDDPASLSAADLRQLRAEGMEIGSHGWAHIPWRGLDPQTARREFVEARDALAEASAGPIATAALPLGRYDRLVLRQLKRSGYARVFTSDRFHARPNAWLQARYSVTTGDSADSIRRCITQQWGAGQVRNLLASLVKRVR